VNIHLHFMLKKISKAVFCLGCLFAAAGVKTTHAQELAAQTIHDLASYGYVLMDDINTPLLHHVATGTPYDPRVLAAIKDGWGDSNSPSGTMRMKASSRDEFQRAEVAGEWGSFIHDRVQALKNAQGYLISLVTDWGEFDFARNRYPIKLRMLHRSPHATFHCLGAYGVENHRYGQDLRTACLTAVNLNANAPFLQYFPLQDLALAREIRKIPGDYRIYALAEPAGKYQLTRGKEIQYMPLDTFVASGIQPVKITGLVLTTLDGRKILAISRMSSEPLGTTASPAATANGAMDNGAAPAQKAGVTARATASAEWKMLAQNSETTFYADPSSIKREGGVVLIRQMLDSSEADAKGRRSFVEIFSYDCNKRTHRLVSMKGYNQSMGRGGVLSDMATPEDFGLVKAGSIAEAMFNFACNAPVPKN